MCGTLPKCYIGQNLHWERVSSPQRVNESLKSDNSSRNRNKDKQNNEFGFFTAPKDVILFFFFF